MSPNDQMPAYSEAVKSGLYAKRSGLVGKYDNVRLYWEDETTREFLRPHLQRLIDRVTGDMRRVRIMDLGCGGADGYDLLMAIVQHNADLQDVEVNLLNSDVFGLYMGVDLNADLLEQAREQHGYNPKLQFRQASFTDGLPLEKCEKPFDLYFSSYGTFSHHNDDATAVNLLADIAERTEDYALVVCDWVGRYSYEWQSLWTDDTKSMPNMDYVISYIYEKEEREARRDELQHLNLRMMSREEAEGIVAEASRRAKVNIRPLEFFDRSVFTGRHMDTLEYNPYGQEIRNAVNSLHEVGLRTPLEALKIDYVPKEGFPLLNDYFEHLQLCWNRLVAHVQELMRAYDDQAAKLPAGAVEDPPASYPKPLREAMRKMTRVVEGTGWLSYGRPRENIIEPQLGYSLRRMVCQMQQGLGAAHGLCAVLEIDKTRK